MMIFLITTGGLWFIRRFDKGFPEHCRIGMLAVFCVVNDVLAGLVPAGKYPKGKSGNYMEIYLCLSLLAGCLMISCITDLLTFQVYNFVWWFGGIGAGCMMLCTKEYGNITALFFFCLLQQLFFSRMYGRADCHAFCVCAAAECALGMGAVGYLVHMLLAYILLAAVQGVRRNIGRKGNLKVPVAFLPYITLSFWLHLFWDSRKVFPRIWEFMH